MNDTERIPEFGEKDPAVEYELRPGGYVVVKNERGEILTVSTPKAIYLPGGAQEDGETLADAAIRETEEECGLRIEVDENLGTADEFAFSESERKHYQKRCTFFTGTITGQGESVERDHKVLWLTPEEAINRLREQSQTWAVQNAEDRVTKEA